jgi:hypothetical protein
MMAGSLYCDSSRSLLRAHADRLKTRSSEHIMRVERSSLIMDDGTEYHANGGIVGLDPYLEISRGYDGSLTDWENDDGKLPFAHRLELADYMIALWTKYKEAQR